ncbi:Matrix-remodeling-associated protein 5 [Merluccius polli]|uniref:Matrix-remodeling-associated protein 5 n=1 Tax=Merluccius polli TaxID=89951 RepID=A0AA47MW75_MERPO|nr:Matrix-remodeling-associated protein 5 [Merluccius polli]
MALPRQLGLVVLLLLCGTQGRWSSPIPLATCPEACVCPDRTQINCSSLGLSVAPRHPSMSRTADLDLSHNLLRAVALHRPNLELRALRLGNNQISYLSLCLDMRSSDGGGRRLRAPEAWRNQRSKRFVSWAPSLLLLSMEKNRLAETPRGLGGSRALQVLQLSYNQISTLDAGDLEGLWQLKELHLHHNLISSLHPQAFMGLTNLTVIDLSFNLLMSVSPATFLSPRVGLEVRGDGNPWRCDCEMASLKRWMALDADRDQRLWLDMVCFSPSSLAGRDLLQLREEDLGCPGPSAQNRPGFHHDLTVDQGSTVLLPCSIEQGSHLLGYVVDSV